MARKKIREYDSKRLLKEHLKRIAGIQLEIRSAQVTESTDFAELANREPWLSTTKLVVKPDMLFGKRGKSGLVALNLDLAQVSQFVKERLGKEVEMGGCKAPITTFIIEPFVPHHQEYYLSMVSERLGSTISFSECGGIEIEENWDKVKTIFLPTEKSMTSQTCAPLIATLPLEVRGKIEEFIKGVFAVFQDLDFSFLEMNPFTLVNGEPYPLDMRGELDDTAAFKNFKKWGNIEFPLPFGRVLSPTESFIHGLDEKTSSSLKFTVLNPKGRIWTMVAGGGASVIYADTVGDLGYASELGNYAEYSGAPNEDEVLQYARVVIDCATSDPDGRKRALLIGGGIANFTDVAATFNGIIRALREKESKLKASRMHIYVRRGGPNYQTGLAKMRTLGVELGVPLEVYGPEATMTGICISSVSGVIRKGFDRGTEGIKNIRESFHFRSPRDSSSNDFNSRRILDPQGEFLQRWNKIFVLACMIAVSVDPLFFYIPVVDKEKNCLDLDHRLEIAASVLRSFTDIFYVVHIFFQFRTGFIAPSSRVFGRGVLVEDASAIAMRYLSSYFLIDILAVLPLPQVVILIIIPKLRGSAPLNAKNLLRFVVLLQYVPRLLRIIPLYREVTRSAGIITETAWAGAVFNLLLYMLASHIIGAIWYLLSIERQDTCWRRACTPGQRCSISSLYCNSTNPEKNDFLLSFCPIDTANETAFNFGIYFSALQSEIVQSRDFPQKFFYCFWWGLQNLSSLGQNLKTSTFVGEILFAVFISICGLVLFSLLIGNMQTYLQSTTVRLEEMRVKRRDAEQWMSHRLLPETLRERIRRYEQYKWQETRGVDEENLLLNLPKDLRRDIKRHLCLALLMRVPMFEKMDEQLLDAMCDCLKPVLYTEDSYIVREGDPVDEMLFVMRGKLESVTTNGGRTGFFNSHFLKAGDFCGEELLTWALDPHSSSNLPTSTRTVRALSEVEAFALKADDLKFVASQFRRLHSKQLRHTFRFYSQQWRTWSACFIQAAWRRYSKKKLEESLREEEDRLQAALAKGGGSSPSLGATIYASRFAANALRALRRNGTRKTRLPERLPPMLLQKPPEPDFNVDDEH